MFGIKILHKRLAIGSEAYLFQQGTQNRRVVPQWCAPAVEVEDSNVVSVRVSFAELALESWIYKRNRLPSWDRFGVSREAVTLHQESKAEKNLQDSCSNFPFSLAVAKHFETFELSSSTL